MSIGYYSGKSIYMMTDDERKAYDRWRRDNPNSAVYADLKKNFKESSEFASYVGKIGWILFGISLGWIFIFPETIRSISFSIDGESIPFFGILNGAGWLLLMIRYLGKYAIKLTRFLGSVAFFVFCSFAYFSNEGFWWILLDFGKACLIAVIFVYVVDYLYSLMEHEYSLNFGDIGNDDDKTVGYKLAIYKEMKSKFGRKKARKMDIAEIYRKRAGKRPKSIEGAILTSMHAKIRKANKEDEVKKEERLKQQEEWRIRGAKIDKKREDFERRVYGDEEYEKYQKKEEELLKRMNDLDDEYV